MPPAQDACNPRARSDVRDPVAGPASQARAAPGPFRRFTSLISRNLKPMHGTRFLTAVCAILAAAAAAGAVAADQPIASSASVLPIVEVGDAPPRAVKSVVGHVVSQACLHVYDQPAAQAEALRQLREKAVKLGANGIVDARMYPIQFRGRTSCWSTFGATGTAVVF